MRAALETCVRMPEWQPGQTNGSKTYAKDRLRFSNLKCKSGESGIFLMTLRQGETTPSFNNHSCNLKQKHCGLS